MNHPILTPGPGGRPPPIDPQTEAAIKAVSGPLPIQHPIPARPTQLTRPLAQMQTISESCVGKTGMAGVAGFAMGGVFGLFMASMAYDTPFHGAPGSGAGAATPVRELPWRQQLRHGMLDMGRRSYSSARNFGKIGALYAGTECCIEGLRAKNDITNAVAAGCVTGGVLAMSAGPQAAALGCAGFAAFSAAIEVWLRRPADGDD